MPADIRPIGLENLEDVVRVMNGSSRGHVFEFGLDVGRFLSISWFWNFSYRHSRIGYAGTEAAGVLLNSVDPDAHDAYSFYWGVLPEHRHRRLSMELAFRYFDQLRAEGFTHTEADASAEAPLRIYEKLGYQPIHESIDLVCERPDVRPQPHCEIRVMDSPELIAQWDSLRSGPVHWPHRATFLRQIERFAQILGAFQNGQMAGYAVVTGWNGSCTMIDFRFLDEAAGLALLEHLPRTPYPPPFICSNVTPRSPEHVLLHRLGFQGKHRTLALRKAL
jgi:hypothetical protein